MITEFWIVDSLTMLPRTIFGYSTKVKYEVQLTSKKSANVMRVLTLHACRSCASEPSQYSEFTCTADQKLEVRAVAVLGNIDSRKLNFRTCPTLIHPPGRLKIKLLHLFAVRFMNQQTHIVSFSRSSRTLPPFNGEEVNRSKTGWLIGPLTSQVRADATSACIDVDCSAKYGVWRPVWNPRTRLCSSFLTVVSHAINCLPGFVSQTNISPCHESSIVCLYRTTCM